jgi:hypothetical protein
MLDKNTIKMANKNLKKKASKFKHLGTKVTNQKCIHEEIK